jgi:hypothetical protein
MKFRCKATTTFVPSPRACEFSPTGDPPAHFIKGASNWVCRRKKMKIIVD